MQLNLHDHRYMQILHNTCTNHLGNSGAHGPHALTLHHHKRHEDTHFTRAWSRAHSTSSQYSNSMFQKKSSSALSGRGRTEPLSLQWDPPSPCGWGTNSPSDSWGHAQPFPAATQGLKPTEDSRAKEAQVTTMLFLLLRRALARGTEPAATEAANPPVGATGSPAPSRTAQSKAALCAGDAAGVRAGRI